MSTLNPGRLARSLERVYGKRAVRRIVERADTGPVEEDLAKYRTDPVGFARDVLHYEPTEDQQSILKALPGRVKVNAGHSVGKTSIAAVIVLWWFHTRPRSAIITTAPTERDVVDLLWTEIRILSARAGLNCPFVGPRAPEMFDNEEHWAKGYTARSGESFQGRHRESMLFVFDEAEGIDPIYWQTTDTMYKPEEDHAWVAIGNPVTTASQSFREDIARGPSGGPKWKLFQLSALNHPNVLAQLAGEPPPVPNAVSLGQVQQWLKDWAEPITEVEHKPADVEWPPGSNAWFRPGPLFKGRVLGIRPTEGVDTVWGQESWELAITRKFSNDHLWMHQFGITIGVDSAVYGDDSSVIHVRSGPCSLHHESHNGWAPKRVADRIKSLSVQWCGTYNSWAMIPGRPALKPQQVKTIIELDGPGVSVFDRCDKFGNWQGLKVAESSEMMDSVGRPMYDSKRSELWFEGEKKAVTGKMDLSRLPQDVLERLREELMIPAYKLLPNGAVSVEPKKDFKRRMGGRSPDNADGLLIAYTDTQTWSPEVLYGKGEKDGY